MTLQEALSNFLMSMRGDKSPETLDWYHKRLRSLLDYLGGERPLDAISTNDLRAWRGELASRTTRYANHPNRSPEPGGLSRHTLRSYVQAAKAFFNWLEAEGTIDNNPARRLEKPAAPNESPKGIGWDDVQKILEAARSDPRDFALVSFLAFTGCRVAGVVGLRLSDLNLEMRLATIHEKGRGGNNKWRTVPFKPETAIALKRWLAARPDVPCDRVFLSHRSTHAPGPMTPNAVYQTLERLAAKAGVMNKANPHNWRHGFARRSLEDGMPAPVVSQILGHSSIGITVDIYGRFMTEQLQNVYDKYVR